MATCLSIVQTICKRLNLNAPSQAIGNTDSQVITIVELCNEEGQELSVRNEWTSLLQTATYTTLATQIQGSLDTIAPNYNYIINDTIWNLSLRRPVFGPKTPQGWQQQLAFAINGPWSNFRIKDNNLLMYPVPSAGQTCTFEYVSKNWLTNSTGATGYEEWQDDTDIPVLDWKLLVLGVVWRWKKLKGFEYAEDFNAYERRVLDSISRDGTRDWLSLSNTKYDIFPGIVVPSGSWNIP